jgi:flagellar basal-body rod modification protein FlgD
MNEISISDSLARAGIGTQAQAAATEDDREDLGQGDFLTLMIAQFRNQDPFEPMDNGEFLGQLAQFGTVDGIEQLNSSFSTLSESLHTDQALQAANLVGHSVLAFSDRGHLPEGGQINGAIELSSSAENVQIDITDASGQLINRIDLGNQAAGLVNFQWNGLNSDHQRAESGNYTISARVIRGFNVESAETLVKSDIDSVNLGRFGQRMTLNLAGGEELSMSQVHRIL